MIPFEHDQNRFYRGKFILKYKTKDIIYLIISLKKKSKWILYVLTNYFKIKINMTGSRSENFFYIQFILKLFILVLDRFLNIHNI